MKTDLPDGRRKTYTLLDLLGTGTTAEVYRCRLSGPRGFEKPVALKKLLPQTAKDPAAVADFADEARLAALLHHENIVQCYDFGETEGNFFLSMECLSGKSLQAVMRQAQKEKAAIPVAHALYVAAEICAGMEYAHTLHDLRQNPLHLVHRELSPDNIMITCEGKVKIIDFGSARADLLDNRFRMGMVKGKIGYMAPEQLTGPEVDRTADIYAIGILLYEMLAGRRLYGGDATTMISKARKGEYIRLEKIAGKLPQAVHEIVDKALQPERNLRYSSCRRMRSEIKKCYSTIEPRPCSDLLAEYIRRLFARELDERLGIPGRVQPAVREVEPPPGPVQKKVASGGGKTCMRHRWGRRIARLAAGCFFFCLAFFLMASRVAEDAGKIAAAPETPPPPASLFVPAEQPSGASAPPPAAKPAAPEAGRKKKIEEYLALAEKAWKEQRLTEPEKDCAFWFYSRMLALDPKNGDAWQGIDRLARAYGDRTEKALSEHDFQEAEKIVEKGLRVFPDNRRLVALRKGLEERRRQYLDDLADRAEQALLRDNLTSPDDDCAYAYFNKILQLDNRNDKALDGLDKIADRYAELAEEAYRNLKIANCREFVKSGLAVSPQHPKLLELQADLNRSGPGIFFKSLEKSLDTVFE